MFDGGAIVAYLAAGFGKQVADRTIRAILDRLTARVVQRLGHSSLDDLRRRPDSPDVRAALERTLTVSARADPTFSRDLERALAQLAERGAGYLIGTVQAQHAAVAIGEGARAVRDIHATFRHPEDVSHAPTWAKTLIALGVASFLIGFGIIGYVGATFSPDLKDPSFGETPPATIVAMTLMFLGAVLSAVGTLAGRLSRGRR